MGKRVIGIDAGGSKTLGLLMDESGAVLRRVRAGGANPRSVGRDQAATNIGDTLHQLLTHGGVAAVCIGAAGIGRESDREFFGRVVQSALPAGTKMLLRHDAQIALRAATQARPAVVVIAGTGSLIYGERSDGSGVRAGGYGAVIGDDAGAYSIGIAALRHAAHALDGVEESGPLSRAVLDAVNASSVEELIERVHVWPPDIGAIASLASLVAEAAEHGDPAARRVISRECESLGSDVDTVVRSVRDSSPLPIIISGGAFEAVPALIEAVRTAAQASGPYKIERPALEPAHGAALLALDALMS